MTHQHNPNAGIATTLIIILALGIALIVLKEPHHISAKAMAEKAKCSFVSGTTKTILENTEIKTAANSKELAKLVGMGFEDVTIREDTITVKDKFEGKITKNGKCSLGEENCFFEVKLSLPESKENSKKECKIYIDDSGIVKPSKLTKKFIK